MKVPVGKWLILKEISFTIGGEIFMALIGSGQKLQ
jgi:hypothetical protein